MTQAEAKKRHAQLVAEINEHNRAYYVEAKPTIPDRDYDRLYHELLDLEKVFPELVTPDSPSQRVGGEPLKAFKPVRHLLPMLSLDNTYSQDEVRDFVKRVQKLLPDEKLDWSVEPKVDGVAVSLRYENGKLTIGATRGDGVTGDDVTANIKTIRSIPLKIVAADVNPRTSGSGTPRALTSATTPEILEVRGEVFMSKVGFEKLNAEQRAAGEEVYANARNTAAGSLKQLDPRIVAKRPLDIVVYNLGKVEGASAHPTTHTEVLNWLKSLGFRTPEKIWHCHSADELIDAINELDKVRKNFPYETDGAVIKLNSFAQRERTGFTAKAPRWAMAYKYAAEQAETKLNGITIQVGRTGALTPVAELEPVFLAGSTISRATLHNEDEIKRKDIRIGDTVVIEKAGEVIPAVIRAIKEKRPHPEPREFDFFKYLNGKCPVCGGEIARDPDFAAWRCQNIAACPAQSVRRVEFLAQRTALDIEGLGGAVAEKLVERNFIKELLDLFDLKIEQLAKLNLGTEESPRIFGEKNATKIVNALERAKSFPLSRWLFALGIQESGETIAFKISQFHNDLEHVANSPFLKGISKLGEIYDELASVSPYSKENKPKNPAEKQRRMQQYGNLKNEILDLGERLQKDGVVDWNKKWKKMADEKRRTTKAVPEFVTFVGTKVAKNIVDFFASKNGQKILLRLRELGVQAKSDTKKTSAAPSGHPFDGKAFVLTGSLESMTRDEATNRIRDCGGNVVGAVSANTNFVVAGKEAGSKLDKAQKLGIKVLTEKEFLTMLGTGKKSTARIQESLF